MTRPFRPSLVRCPVTKVSTVTTDPVPGRGGPVDEFLGEPPSRRMYSWNHRSGCAASATASIVVVAIVDSV